MEKPYKKLQWIGSIEAYESISSESTIKELWHLINFAASEETLSSCIPSIDKELMSYICESITQAEEFSNSASTSSIHTKPLLTYYSIHNLTKAMLVMETNKKSIGYHGLMKVDLPEDGNFLGVSVKVNEGVFSNLLSFKGISPIKGLKITVEDLIKRCVYLVNDYRMAYKGNSIVIFPSLSVDMDWDQIDLCFNKTTEVTEMTITTLLPKLQNYFELIDSEKDTLHFKSKANFPKGNREEIQKLLPEIFGIGVFSQCPIYLVPCIDLKLDWPQEAILFSLSFILSSLVRYYPDYWYKNVISHRRNIWLIKKMDSIIERVYPNLMLNIMFGNRIYRFNQSRL